MENILGRKGGLTIKDPRELLHQATARLDVHLTDNQLDQFETYMAMLLDWRTRFNITTISQPRQVVLKHFVDSLTTAAFVASSKSIIDIGTGGGFPGIPLKIALPHLKVTLLDAASKKVNFLEAVIDALGLSQVTPIHGRAEDLGHKPNHREGYDIAISRAVTAMPTLVEYCLPFVRPQGHFIAMKGARPQEEVDAAATAITTLGGACQSITSLEIPFTDIKHSIIIISKLSHTLPRYPRNASQIAKRPIM